MPAIIVQALYDIHSANFSLSFKIPFPNILCSDLANSFQVLPRSLYI